MYFMTLGRLVFGIRPKPFSLSRYRSMAFVHMYHQYLHRAAPKHVLNMEHHLHERMSFKRTTSCAASTLRLLAPLMLFLIPRTDEASGYLSLTVDQKIDDAAWISDSSGTNS